MLVGDYGSNGFSLSTLPIQRRNGSALRLNLTSLQRWISQSLRFEARDLDNISWLRVVLANAASRKLDHRMSPKTS